MIHVYERKRRFELTFGYSTKKNKKQKIAIGYKKGTIQEALTGFSS